MNRININTNNQTLLHLPEEQVGLLKTNQSISGPKLTYRGGKILKNPTFDLLFLGKFWTSQSGTPVKDKIVDFSHKFFGSDQMKIWNEYGSQGGKVDKIANVAPKSSPTKITDSQIQKTIASSIAAGTVPKPGPEQVYSVFLPPGTEVIAPGEASSKDGVGGYHMSFDLPDKSRVYYSVVVYSEKGNGVSFSPNSLDNITIARLSRVDGSRNGSRR